jgi:hypothetical protein
MEVELTMVPFTTDDDGNEVVTFAWTTRGFPPGAPYKGPTDFSPTGSSGSTSS